MKTLTDKIAGYRINFDRRNYQKTLNHVLLGAMLSLTYPSENSNSSITLSPSVESLQQYHIRLSEKQKEDRDYRRENNKMFSLEDIADKSLIGDVKLQLDRINHNDFKEIVGRISKYKTLIQAHSQNNNLDDYLVASVIYHESSGNPQAVSPKGAMGLMQVTQGTAQEIANRNRPKNVLTKKEILTPEKNIAFGTKYLSDLIDRYNDNVMLGLAAYNLGPGKLDRILERNRINSKEVNWNDVRSLLPRETRTYVPKVFSGMLKINKSYGPKS